MKLSDIEDQLDLFSSDFLEKGGESETPSLCDAPPSQYIGLSTDGQGDLFN